MCPLQWRHWKLGVLDTGPQGKSMGSLLDHLLLPSPHPLHIPALRPLPLIALTTHLPSGL